MVPRHLMVNGPQVPLLWKNPPPVVCNQRPSLTRIFNMAKAWVALVKASARRKNLFEPLFTFLRVCLHFSGANHKALILHVTLWCIFS